MSNSSTLWPTLTTIDFPFFYSKGTCFEAIIFGHLSTFAFGCSFYFFTVVCFCTDVLTDTDDKSEVVRVQLHKATSSLYINYFCCKAEGSDAHAVCCISNIVVTAVQFASCLLQNLISIKFRSMHEDVL